MPKTLEEIVEMRIHQLKEDNATMVKAIDFGPNDVSRIIGVSDLLRDNEKRIGELSLVLAVFKQEHM